MTTLSFSYELTRHNEYKVKVPYQLKEIFKKTFPSAKWHYDSLSWILGASCEARLKQFEAAIEEELALAAAEAQKISEDELCEAEVRKIELEVVKIREELHKRRESQNVLNNAKQLLQTKKTELALAQAELKAEQEKHLQVLADAEAEFKKACDYDAVIAARKTLCSLYKTVGSANRQKFVAAQEIINREHKRLKSSGFYSRGLSDLYNLNYNRPDRDNPNDIKITDIFKIKEYDQEISE
jgi:hypothetical protein